MRAEEGEPGNEARVGSLSGQRSYAYVMRAEEGEPGNEAMNILLPQDHSSAVCGVCQT